MFQKILYCFFSFQHFLVKLLLFLPNPNRFLQQIQITASGQAQFINCLTEIAPSQFSVQTGLQNTYLLFQGRPFPDKGSLPILLRLSLTLTGHFPGHHGLHSSKNAHNQTDQTNAQNHTARYKPAQGQKHNAGHHTCKAHCQQNYRRQNALLFRRRNRHCFRRCFHIFQKPLGFFQFPIILRKFFQPLFIQHTGILQFPALPVPVQLILRQGGIIQFRTGNPILLQHLTVPFQFRIRGDGFCKAALIFLQETAGRQVFRSGYLLCFQASLPIQHLLDLRHRFLIGNTGRILVFYICQPTRHLCKTFFHCFMLILNGL